jgi:hypothetical protein
VEKACSKALVGFGGAAKEGVAKAKARPMAAIEDRSGFICKSPGKPRSL